MYQSITVIGRLGRDPEMRHMANGDPVTSFSIASDRSFMKGNERVKETTWFRITIFGKQAEACNQYLSKGKMVLVEGRMGIDSATGGPKIFVDKAGKSGTSFEIVANTVRFLSANEEAKTSTGHVSTEDVPF